MPRKSSLVDRYGKLPAGMSKADVDAVLQFLYGAFDGKTAKQVKILYPHTEEGETLSPELSVFEFCRWLRAVAA
jgi:hypothetical protein